jgi:hypothetical protein
MFEYLKPYIYKNVREKVKTANSFYPVSKKEIDDYEKYYRYALPTQLKTFYKELGYGFLTHPHQYNKEYAFCNTNRFNPPSLMNEMLLQGQESGLISEDAHELLYQGDLPFFEIGDSSSFMFMKALSDNPNAVWYMGAIKIEDSLEAFVHNLYYRDPAYYANTW